MSETNPPRTEYHHELNVFVNLFGRKSVRRATHGGFSCDVRTYCRTEVLTRTSPISGYYYRVSRRGAGVGGARVKTHGPRGSASGGRAMDAHDARMAAPGRCKDAWVPMNSRGIGRGAAEWAGRGDKEPCEDES